MRRVQPSIVALDKPMALVASSPRGVMITAVNAPAIKCGVHVGQMLADARAVFPMLLTRSAEPERDRQALKQLALWLGRYGPVRNTDSDDGLWVDITGVAHLFGGEPALARDCVGRLERAGFYTLAAIADTRSGAHALARHGRMHRGRMHKQDMHTGTLVAPPGQTRQSLADLPVQGLQLTEDLVILLRRLGLKQIGQLYQLPRATMARRFRDASAKIAKGRKRRKDLVRATAASYAGWAEELVMRLDQALGDLSEPEPGIKEPPRYRVQRAYAEPLISSEGIVAALVVLAGRLCLKLEQNGQGARALRFTIFRADSTCAEIEVGTSRPARDAAHIIELFQPRLEHMDAGLGLDAIVLEALHTNPLSHEQTGFTASASGQGPALLIDRLSNRCGGNAVFYLEDVASHIPERSQRRVTALRGQLASRAQEATEHPLPADRPTFLLAPPEPVHVMAAIPDGVPARFTWRRITRRITHAVGPERIAPEWWRLIGSPTHTPSAGASPYHTTRDYYKIEDEHGGLYWIYRSRAYPIPQETQPELVERSNGPAPVYWGVAASASWYLHGLF